MANSGINLSNLFDMALQTMADRRQEVNELDGYNGNHGDNMVNNLRLIREALQARQSQPPAQALDYAGQVLEKQGQGGTSQYYARGLHQAASRFQGKQQLDNTDIVDLIQTLMGSIPAEGYPEQPQASSQGTVLDALARLQEDKTAQPQSQPQQTPQSQDGRFDLGDLIGMVSGQKAQLEEQSADDGFGLDDVVETLLPAGLAYLQAKRSGADTQAAARQALVGILLGGKVNPLQSNSPRTAAGGLVAQSLLKALAGGH